MRQRGVVRKPAHVHNYVHNAQMVIDALAGPILNMNLSHITGEAIVRGDTVAIRYEVVGVVSCSFVKLLHGLLWTEDGLQVLILKVAHSIPSKNVPEYQFDADCPAEREDGHARLLWILLELRNVSPARSFSLLSDHRNLVDIFMGINEVVTKRQGEVVKILFISNLTRILRLPLSKGAQPVLEADAAAYGLQL